MRVMRPDINTLLGSGGDNASAEMVYVLYYLLHVC